MAGYDVFARYYDALTANVDYAARAAYLSQLLHRFHHDPGLTLDLACGTGRLTLELHKLGFDVYGVDGSIAMLSEAKDRAYDADADILFLCQQMQNLDLYGTVDTVFCSLDSINHLRDAQQVQEVFRRVAIFLNDDGWFIFDMNTPYKHAHILANQVYTFDLTDLYCVWQNKYNPKDRSVGISLDFFEREGKLYSRSHEHFSEQVYDQQEITAMLENAGFDRICFFGDMRFDAPAADEQRWIIAAHITNSQNGVYTD